jgi:hypothetical protein
MVQPSLRVTPMYVLVRRPNPTELPDKVLRIGVQMVQGSTLQN